MKVDAMIEITITEDAKIELLKVMSDFSAKAVRLVRQGYG